MKALVGKLESYGKTLLASQLKRCGYEGLAFQLERWGKTLIGWDSSSVGNLNDRIWKVEKKLDAASQN